jgi:hypothetical protein
MIPRLREIRPDPFGDSRNLSERPTSEVLKK